MARDNKTQYALLGVLTQFECTGYDIKKFIETSLGYFWKESFGQIYPNLKKLENDGFISSRSDKTNPEKTLYSITEPGRKKLSEWLKQPAENTGYRNELLLKLFFGRQMGTDNIRKHLSSRRAELDGLLSEYQNIKKNITGECRGPDTPFWMITLDFGIKTAEAELEWINISLKNLKRG